MERITPIIIDRSESEVNFETAAKHAGKDGGEGAPSRIVKEPETSEDEKGEKFHLLHSF